MPFGLEMSSTLHAKECCLAPKLGICAAWIVRQGIDLLQAMPHVDQVQDAPKATREGVQGDRLDGRQLE